VAAMFFLTVASDWVQLPTVEPGGKLEFNPRLCGKEEECHIQPSEASRKTDVTQIKTKTVDTITKFASEKTSGAVTDQLIVNTENYESVTQTQNTKFDLNHDNPVIMQSIPNTHYSKSESHDSTENNFESHMSEERESFIQPPYQLPSEFVLEKEANDINTPQFKAHLATSNLNIPDLQPKSDQVTAIQVDTKLPKPEIYDHPPNKDSTSKFSDSFYETNLPSNPTVQQNTENHERITIMKPNVTSTDAESGPSWISRRGNSNNKTEENTEQDASLPFVMLKAVHETLIQEIPHTIRGKMHFLQQLKDKMLHYLGKVIILHSTLCVKLL
jgi:hypothetical protein